MLLSLVVVLAGCGADAAKQASGPLEQPSPPPPPAPAPAPVVEPVVGAVEIITDDSSWNDQLGLADDGGPAEGSVEAATQAVASALDAYLDSAQAGEPALEQLQGAWLRDSDPAAIEVLERGLTNPDNLVAAASYLMRVQLEPDPTLIAANVQIQRRDGTSVKVELVFDVTGEQPRLQVAGGAEAL